MALTFESSKQGKFQSVYAKWCLIIDLLPFAKLLELLAMNHSSSERRISFVPRLLKFSHVLVVLGLAWVRTSPQLSWIAWSRLALFRGCWGSCSIVPNGPTGLVVSFNMCQRLKYKHLASTLTWTMWLLCSN